MTRRPVSARAVGEIAVAVVIVIAVIVTIRILRDSAPQARLPHVGTAAPDSDDPDIVTCERTLPDAEETQQAIDQVEPVGLISSTEVLECPDAFDQQVVVYVGEVIGDVLNRDGGAWLLVNDDDYALEVGPLRGHGDYRGGNSGLAVWLPAPLPDLEPGRGDVRGTVIQVRGRIHRSDAADGGGLTLRALSADTVSILREAQDLDRPVHRAQAVAAVLFALLAAGITLQARRSESRR